MAIIYSYPTSTNLTGKDILVLTDPETTGNPTKSVTLASIASYVTGTGTGTGTTNTLTLWTDGPGGSLGDSILTQDVGATALTLNGNFISTGTGNFTGQVTIPTTPVAATDAASKNYVDTEVAGIPAGLVFKGNWDANLNSPALASGVGTVGNYYVVSVAGNTNLDGITDWQVGDWAVFVEVGGVDKWDKIDQTFVSGNGAAGQVTFWNTINTVDGDNAFFWDNVNKRLGVGATSPGRDLQVGDGSSDSVIAIVGPGAGLSQLALGTTVDDNYAQILLDNSSDKLQIQNGGGGTLADRGITLDSSENVGIGTSSPSSKLQVNAGTENLVAEFESTDSISEIRIKDSTAYSRLLNVGTQLKLMPNDGVEMMILDGNDNTINLPDSKTLTFGDSDDLQIYHDGSNSYIDETGTGSLYIKSAGAIRLQSDTGENMIYCINDGAVNLYHNNVNKVQTTAAGANVTGTLDTDNLTIAGAQGSAGDVLTSSGTGVSWQAGGGGGGATDLNGLSDCLVDTDSLYVGEVPSGLSGNPQDNTILGIRAGDSLTSGDSNTLIGNNAGDSITTGTNSVAVGMDALAGASTVGNNVAIGKNAYKVGTAANNVYMGYDAGSAATTGSYQVGIGVSAGNSDTGAGTISMGWFANRNNTALGTISIGYQAGYSHTSGTGGVNVGYEAGKDNTTGASRTMIGYRAGKSNTGGWNTFIGTQCGFATGSGIMNVGIGSNNMAFAAMGNFNISVGHQAAQQLEGNENVIIGHEAGQYTSTVDDSVMVGFNAGKAITTGDQNTLIGSKAGYSGTNDLTTGADNVLIGFEAEASSATVSNEVNLYNGSVVARFQGAAAAWSFVSDARDKKDIEDLELGLDFVTKLKPRKFKWDLRNSEVDKNKNASGFVAQEVKEVLDEINADYTGIVDTNNSEQYTVSQSNIIPMLVNAVKELKEEIEQLKKS